MHTLITELPSRRSWGLTEEAPTAKAFGADIGKALKGETGEALQGFQGQINANSTET